MAELAANSTPEVPVNPDAKHHRLLVVDDEDFVCALVVRIAETQGFEVSVAANGREAEKLMARTRFDVLVTDLYMPEKDGLELIRQLRDLRPAPAIIAMSGGGAFGFDALRAAGFLGAAHILGKPFDVSQLIELLARAVRGDRASALG